MPKPHRLILAGLAAVAALAVSVPTASATTTSAKIGSYDCSVYAQTPALDGGLYVNANGWASCGATNYEKQVRVELWDLETGGWKLVDSANWSGFTWDN